MWKLGITNSQTQQSGWTMNSLIEMRDEMGMRHCSDSQNIETVPSTNKNSVSLLNTETGGFHEALKDAEKKRFRTQTDFDLWNIGLK